MPYRDPDGVERCTLCEHPLDDCQCAECDECGEMYINEGGRYSYCPSCRANNAPWRDDDGRPTFHGTPSARYPRFLGVEIECGVKGAWGPVERVMDAWNIGLHDDGSVHVDGASHELVTAPARGDSFERQIDDLCDALHKSDARVNKSCGLHVHVDVRDLTTAQVLGIVRLYSRIEKTLYSLVARSRRSNTFTSPWGEKLTEGAVLDTTASVTDREKALDLNTYGSERAAQYAKEYREKHGSRYHGLNLNAIHVHGTLEFRLHHGTVNARKIKAWAAVCSAIVEHGATHTEEEIGALRGTPAEVLERVLGTDREIVGWTRARRRFFEEKERERRGLPPRRAAQAPRAAPIPAVEAGPAESGELPQDAGRVGRRAFRA